MRNLPRSFLRAAGVALAFIPLAASAHPGHDDHDFTWDLSHLAAHPIATLLCVTLIAASGWLVSRAVRSHRAQAKDTRS